MLPNNSDPDTISIPSPSVFSSFKTYLRNNWQPIAPVVFLLIVFGGITILGFRYLRVGSYQSRAMSSGPNVPLIYGQDLAPGMTFKQGEGLLQLVQLIKDVKTNYGKTDWDLNQLDPPSSSNWVDPIPPERATLVYEQWIRSPNQQTSAPVEGGAVTMFIGKDGAKDDVLSDGFIPGITPRDPYITKAQALDKVILPLDAKASSPELVYHILEQDFRNTYDDSDAESLPTSGDGSTGMIKKKGIKGVAAIALGEDEIDTVTPSPEVLPSVETTPSVEATPEPVEFLSPAPIEETPQEISSTPEPSIETTPQSSGGEGSDSERTGDNPVQGGESATPTPTPRFPYIPTVGDISTQKAKIGQNYRLAYRTVISEAVAPFIADELGGYGSRWRGTNFTSSGSSCTQNSQCTVPGDICFAGQCQPPGLQGGSCDVKQGSAGCAAGLVCNSSTKTCESTNVMQECTVNADCNLDPKNPTKICGTDNLCHIDETKLPPGAASGEGNGLMAGYVCYYNDTNTYGNAMYSELDADDPTINYTWLLKGPTKLNCSEKNYDQTRYNHFGAGWGGVLIPPTTGTYTFYLDVDDSGYIKVGATTVIDSSGKPKGEYSGTIDLIAGQHYGFGAYMREKTQNAKIIVSWTKPGSQKELLPRKYLYTYDALPPQITTQPASVTVMQTQQVQLSVITDGTKPLTIQWQKGGVDIPGATGLTYTIPAATIGDSGPYTATVTNAFGSDTSQTAQVTVNPFPGGSGYGLHGYYYVDTNLSPDKLNTDQVDSQVNFHWGFLSPFSGVECHLPTPCWRGEGFGVRWYGDVYAPVAGDYFFGFKTVGGGEHQWAGARVWVDGQLKIDNWYIPSTKLLWTQAVAITTPGKHRIRVDYWSDKKKRFTEADNINNDSSAELWWRGPNIAQGVIPTEALFFRDFEYLNQKPNVEIGDTVWIDATTGTILDRASSSFDAIGADHFKKYYPWLEEAKQKAKETTQNVSKKVVSGVASIFGGVAKAAASPPGSKAPPEGSNFGTKPSYGNASPFNYCADGYDAQGRFSYFGSIFYDKSNFTDPTNGQYKHDLNDYYSTSSPPASGMTKDNDWSAVFDTIFSVVNNDGSIPPPGTIFTIYSYPTFAGQFTVYVYDAADNLIYSQSSTNSGSPWEVSLPAYQVFSNQFYHMTVEYKNVNMGWPALVWNDQICDVNSQNCNSKQLFWAGINTPIRPDQLYYTQKPADTSGQVESVVQFTMNYANVNTGTPAMQWHKNNSNIGGNSKVLNYTVQGGDNGALFDVALSNSTCQLVDKLKKAVLTVSNSTPTPTPTPTPSVSPTPTPTPTPGPGDLKCTTVNGTDTITVNEGEYAVFKASNYEGSSTPTFNACEQAVPNKQNNGTDTFVTKFNLPTGGGSGYCEPAPVKNPVKVTSFNKTAYCYAVIQPKDCLADCTTPTPTPTPPPQTPTPTPGPPGEEILKNTLMYAYEHSPISSLDCSLTYEKYSTSQFLIECSPHELANPPKLVKTSTGLKYRTEMDTPDLLTVASRKPAEWTVSVPDNGNLSQYYSIFDGSLQDDQKISQVGQINAYQTILKSLKDFSNTMWPAGASPMNQYLPNGNLFKNLKLYATLVPDGYINNGDDPESGLICGKSLGSDGLLVLAHRCALDNEVINHELFHILGSRFNKFNRYFYNTGGFELSALMEGTADYFSLRNTDDRQYIADYGLGQEKRPILALETSDLSYPYFTLVDGISDYHGEGSLLANILTQMRRRIENGALGDRQTNLLTFDRAVVFAYAKIVRLYTDNRHLTSGSIFQQFYIEMYSYLSRHDFLPAYLAYFKNDLLYSKAQIGVGAGNAMRDNIYSTSGSAARELTGSTCSTNDKGEKVPVFWFSFPVMNAIGANVTRATINFSPYKYPHPDFPVPVKSFMYDKDNKKYALTQPSMHSPVYFSASGGLDLPDGKYNIYFTVSTDDGHTSKNIFTIDPFIYNRSSYCK